MEEIRQKVIHILGHVGDIGAERGGSVVGEACADWTVDVEKVTGPEPGLVAELEGRAF